MQSGAADVDSYLGELDPERRATISAVRDVVLAHLPDGFEEGMDFGMISWHVPLARYPETYNGHPIGTAALASQKRYVSLYLMGIYADPQGADWFRQAWTAAGHRLDMGRACVRFRRLDDVPLGVVGQAIARTSVEALVARYEQRRAHLKH
jgi:Domain of unknown function (DU1801)